MKTKKIKVLIIEDSEDDLKLLLRELNKSSYKIIHKLVEDAKGLESALQEDWDVIISDYSLPGFSGLEALKMCNEKGIDIPFIIVSGTVGEDIAVDTMTYGAKDYIMKNNLIRLLPAIEREITDTKIRREKKRSEEELKESELRFRSVTETANDAIITTNSKGIISGWNRGAERIFGYTKEDMTGKEINMIIPQRFFEQHIKGIKSKEQVGEHHLTGKKIELIGLNKNGNEFPLELSLSEWETSSGKFFTGIIRDITERTQAEMQLKESEEKFRVLFEGSAHGILTADIETHRFLFSNPSICRMFGYSDEELRSLSINDLHPKDSLDSVMSEFESQIRGEKPLSEALPCLRKDGTVFYADITASPTIMNGRKCIVGFFADVTERKQAEEALRKSEKKYRVLIENMGEGVGITDKEEKFIFINPAAENIFGVGQGELDGENLSRFFSKETFKEVKKRTDERRQGKISSYEEEIVLRDGSKKNIIVTATPWYEDKIFKGTFAIFRDITMRKRAEELLKASEEKYRNLIETMPEGFYRSTEEGYFIDVNPALVEMLGYDSKEELMKIYIPEALYFSKEERLKEVNYNIDFIPDSEIYRLKKKDGSEIWVEDHSRYIKDSSGNVLYHEGIMRDVTESLRARNAILEAKEKAEEMSRLKSNILANMSHEIRTPLNGILGFSDIIKEENDLKVVKEMAGIINDSGNRLLSTLNQILDLSSLESNTKKVNFKLIDINYLIKEATVLFSIAAQKKNLVLKSESDIFSPMSYTDPNLISNTLNNLISNAIIYTKGGSVTVRAKEEIINEKNCIVINVIDTGIGIEKKNLEIIFDEFRQVSEGWGRSFEGTGLGLSLCKKYMNLLGGSISVTSKLGIGSDFRIVIPKNILKDDKGINSKDDKSVKTSRRNSLQIKSGIKPKILYIEDDPECVKLVKYIVTNQYDIDSAASGAEGIEKTKNNEYGLILLDINLSKGISGLEALSEIRKIPYYKDIPVIALTAFAMAGDEKEFRAGGCTDYISKPFKKEMLLEKISKTLSQYVYKIV
jgi:PAS domain S-box-containing protein